MTVEDVAAIISRAKVLVGVCDECDQVCLLPHQSTPAVQKQMEAQRKAVEIRLPAHMLDIISLAAFELGGSSDFVPNLMKYYIHKLAHDPEVASSLPALLDGELTAGKAEKRLSLKGGQITDDIDRLKATTGIVNTTDLIKSVILLINKDVLTEKQPRSIQNLKDVFAAVA